MCLLLYRSRSHVKRKVSKGASQPCHRSVVLAICSCLSTAMFGLCDLVYIRYATLILLPSNSHAFSILWLFRREKDLAHQPEDDYPSEGSEVLNRLHFMSVC